MTTTMTDGEKKELQARVQAWTAQGEGYSQAQFAQKIGISDAYVTKIVRGDWNDRHPSAAIWQRVAGFFGSDAHLDTENYQMIVGACAIAQAEKSCVGIDGYSGAGKTYALRRYAAATPNAYHVICRDSMSIRDFLSALARAVGADARGTRYEMENAIVRALRGRNALLIIDEAEYLKPAALHNVKTFHDLLVKTGAAGLVLCGFGIRKALERDARRERRGMAQIHRRFDLRWVEMKPLTRAEIHQVAAAHGITDAEAHKWLAARITNYDTLNLVLRDAMRVAGEAGRAVSVQMLHELFN